jgi:hypothetical protein
MAYLAAVVPLLLEVFLIVHVFRTGRERWWIYLIFFVPLAGSIAYLLVEVLPDAVRGRGAAAVKRGVTRTLDPGRSIRDAEKALAIAPTVENRSALAEAWREAGEPARAVDLYAACLTGIYRTDRILMSRMAVVLHEAGYHERARQLWDELVKVHGPLRDDRELLSRASALQSCGETGRAEECLREAALRSPGLEARYRLAAFYRAAGRTVDAERETATILQAWDLMPRFSRREQKPWADAARREAAETPAARGAAGAAGAAGAGEAAGPAAGQPAG